MEGEKEGERRCHKAALRQLLTPPRNSDDAAGAAAAARAAVEFVALGGLELAANCATAATAAVRRRGVEVLSVLLLKGCGDIGESVCTLTSKRYERTCGL